MVPKAMRAKHAVPLMLRRNVKTGEVALACPCGDVEERGGGEGEKDLIGDALRQKPKRPNYQDIRRNRVSQLLETR